MNRKEFLTLIVLGLIVGGLGIYIYNQRKASFSASSFESGQKVIKDFPLNEIGHVRIKHGTNEVNLTRSEDTWKVQERFGYPANFSELSEFLRKVWELKPVQDVEVGPSQYARLELATETTTTNAGTLVEFKDAKSANLKSLILGKKQIKESAAGPFGGGGEFPVGRYILVPENPPRVWLVNETFANVEPKPEQWLNKDFLKIEKVKSVSVNYPENPTNSWSVSRDSESGEWKLADPRPGEAFDASKASSLNYALSSPSFNDVAAPDAALEAPTTAKLETFEGFVYTINLGKTNDDNHLLKLDVQANLSKERTPGADEKPEDKEKLDKEFKEKNDKLQEKLKNEQRFKNWTYLVSKWTVDSLLKQRKDLMAEKKEEPAKDEAPKPADAPAPPIETIPPELKNLPVPPVPETKPAEEPK
jgi:hypothetical protein